MLVWITEIWRVYLTKVGFKEMAAVDSECNVDDRYT
jgi:hypothetical protein